MIEIIIIVVVVVIVVDAVSSCRETLCGNIVIERNSDKNKWLNECVSISAV